MNDDDAVGAGGGAWASEGEPLPSTSHDGAVGAGGDAWASEGEPLPSTSHDGGARTSGVPLPLEVIRAERALTKRRLSSMSPTVRSELLSRKRQVELERFLLPDAPPRRRQTRKPSPERQPCPLVEDLEQLEPEPEAELVELVVGFQIDEPEVEHPEIVVAEHLDEVAVEPEMLDYENMDFIIVGEEVEASGDVQIQPETTQKASIDYSDTRFESVEDDWLRDGDSDEDLEVNLDDNDDNLLPVMRNATTEPACNADMTELQSQILQAEDDLNDKIVRDMVPSDDYYSFDWKKDRTIFTGRRETFTGSSGPTFDLTDMTPVDIFYKMFDKDFIDRLCRETNRYAEQKIAGLKAVNKFLPTSRLHRWTPTDCDEMITFLAVLILQGLYPLPEEEKYFSFNGYGTMPYFSRIMSYNRFSLLKSVYHFVDNSTLTNRTKLDKLQPVIDYLNDKFSTLYMPAQEIAIDESLLKWHGHLSFAQKIATKAAQVGVKTYELCESRSGYLWKFFVYVGKKTAQQPDRQTVDRPDDTRPEDDTDLTPHERHEDELLDEPQDETNRPEGTFLRPTDATAKIVFNLVDPLLDRGHTLIMDNFYNSPLLLRCLKRHKTDCYGTLRLNREFVPDSLKTLNKSDLRQGEVITTYTSDLSVMVWRDANLVSMISTYHHIQAGRQNKYNRLTYKPKIVLDYNKSMGGVDRKDQFLSAQPVERVRNKVWYKKTFCRLLNTAVFNAFVIFSSLHPKLSHRQFRINLTESLIKIHRRINLTTEPRLFTTRTGQRHLTPRTPDRPNVDHDHFPARTTLKKPRCYMCTRRGRQTRTTWKCIQCDIHLCIEHCFREYHKPGHRD